MRLLVGIFLWGAEPDAWIGNQMSSGGSGGSEASVNQPTNAAGPSNANRGGPSASPQDSTTVDQPAPPLIPYVSLLHQEGERGALLRELHSLVSFQFKRHCEMGLPRWRRTNSTQVFDEAALVILGFDLEISPNMEIAELREWIEAIRNNPRQFAGIYNQAKIGKIFKTISW